MAQTVGGQVGPTSAGDNTYPPIRQGRSAEVVVTELHGRFYEQVYRGNVYSGGMGLTTINNTTYTTNTLGATCTPIAGVWNPSNSTVNLVILQAIVGVTITAATATGAGPFAWAYSIANTAITTGTAPLNRKTLSLTGSQAKHYANIALTGLTTTLVVMGVAGTGGGSGEAYSFVATAAGTQDAYVATTDNVDGGIIVPPGGVLALLATTTPVAHSASSMIIWEEVPL